MNFLKIQILLNHFKGEKIKKILFVLLVALCGVSFGKPISSSDSTEVLPVEPVPEVTANPDPAVCAAFCNNKDIANKDIEKEIEQCIDECINK